MTVESSQQQNEKDFASRRNVGIAGAFHPDRWERWLDRCATSLGLPRTEFEREIRERALLVVATGDPHATATIQDIYPKKGRGRSRQAWHAYWIGETIRSLQERAGLPARQWASGLESLAFGGYYGDMIAVIGLISKNETDGYTRMAAERFAQPKKTREILEPGIHGWTIVCGDYEAMLAENVPHFPISDTRPFNHHFVQWIKNRRGDFHWLFEFARQRIAAGDENHALEFLWDGFALSQIERSGINPVRESDLPENKLFEFNRSVYGQTYDPADAILRRYFYGSDGIQPNDHDADAVDGDQPNLA